MKNIHALNFISLNFKNKKYEEEYTKSRKASQKKINLRLTVWCCIFSLVILSWVLCLNYSVKYNLQQNSINIIQGTESELESLRNITNVYFNRYVVLNDSSTLIVNGTKNSNGENTNNYLNYLPIDQDFTGTVRKYAFAKSCLILSICITIIYILLLLTAIFSRSEFFYLINFSLLYFLFGFNFHIISGILRSFYYFSSDSILFMVTTQLFFRIILVLLSSVKWIHILNVCILNLISEWCILSSFHYQIPESLISYLCVNDLILFLSVGLSYYNEYFSKLNFFLLKRLKFEREYLMNFLCNMEEGYITYSNKKILFMNKSMQKLIHNYEKLLIVANNREDKYLSSIPNVKNSINDENDNLFHSEKFNFEIKPDMKFFLEQILQNMTELNKELPNEILNLFKKEYGGFQIDNFINKIQNNSNFDNFVFLGNINFEKINRSIVENEPEFTSYRYQVCFRKVDHEEDRGVYFEMIFTDISRITKLEREKTIDDCRSLYLSKVAHEFKNPLTSLIELTKNIKDSAENTENKEEICSYADHSELICKIMEMFIKDFTVFANINNKITKYNKELNISKNNENRDKIGQIQMQKCEDERNTFTDEKNIFDFSEIIFDFSKTFENLSKYENKNIKIKSNSSFSNKIISAESYLIYADKKMFHSVIFNILYYSYKNTNTGQITISSHVLDNDKIQFEITDTGFEIDSTFIQNLENKQINFEQKTENIFDDKYISFNQFNKYLGLYIAYSIANKLESNLIIESSKLGSKYSFILFRPKGVAYQIGSDISKKSLFENKRNSSFKRSNSIKNHASDKIIVESSNTIETVIMENPFEMGLNKPFYEILNLQNSSHDKYSENEISLDYQQSEIKKVLIVDDEKLIRNTIKRNFKKLNEVSKIQYEVSDAENALVALNMIFENLMKNNQFDFIITDECMPFLRGSSLIKILIDVQKEGSLNKMIIISHTAFDTVELKTLILKCGADVIWNKPVKFEDFKLFFDSC